MGIEIKGIDKLMKKLDQFNKLDTKNTVQKVAKIAEKEIKAAAKEISDTSYLYVGEVEVREKGLSCFIDVGLSNDLHPFVKWQSLWFQHWGFYNYGLNFTGQYYIKNHQLWFNQAVDSFEERAKTLLKEELKREVRKCLK